MRWIENQGLIFGFIFLSAASALAQMRPVRVYATVQSAASKAECKAEVVAMARVKAVLKHASEATRPMLERRSRELEDLVDPNYQVVEFGKTRGGCQATVDFRVDIRALVRLERSLLSERVPNIPIGVLIRYRVDGKLARQAGMNSRQATHELEAALSKYGYSLVSLAVAQEDYDKMLSSQEEYFRSAEEWQGSRRQDDEGGVVASLLEDMRQYLGEAVELGPMRACGGWVLFGELSVQDHGPNPYGQGSKASATLLLQIHRLDNSQPVVLPANESRQVIGENPDAARDQARTEVLAPVTRQIAEQIAGMPSRKFSQCTNIKKKEKYQ